jgi:hypothetical protein
MTVRASIPAGCAVCVQHRRRDPEPTAVDVKSSKNAALPDSFEVERFDWNPAAAARRRRRAKALRRRSAVNTLLWGNLKIKIQNVRRFLRRIAFYLYIKQK